MNSLPPELVKGDRDCFCEKARGEGAMADGVYVHVKCI